MSEIYIKDVKTKDIIQTFEAYSLGLGIYKVLDIYKSENDKRIFKCIKMQLNEKRSLIETDIRALVDEKDVLSVCNKIKREY